MSASRRDDVRIAKQLIDEIDGVDGRDGQLVDDLDGDGYDGEDVPIAPL
eukprot:CAMPEP_0119387684 /NCGR_PEP_ID=MMETSP1334-20130426/101755_1 /TAXON_ID=127549 /ORGANISM="Calcidiscus leptoporus, Strain RCC1130" /LENGTH=48 /DNA_ID= /DNA_START= /DNA_END= /DNA_ORIENTATION=